MTSFFNFFIKKKKQTFDDNKIKKKDFSSFRLVTDYIYEKSGITDLDKKALTSLNLQNLAISKGIFSTREFLQSIEFNKELYQQVINIATVNETFFFREIRELKWLVDYIQKENRYMKILSLPCSSGEEVYSILLLLDAEGFNMSKIMIDGYDINSDAILKANKAIYDEYSLHNIDFKIRNKNFIKSKAGKYELVCKYKKCVNFYQENIFNLNEKKDKYDIILSRNMFIYFDDEKRKLAIQKIVNLLKKDAIFIKGHADYIYNCDSLKNVHYGIYKKII